MYTKIKYCPLCYKNFRTDKNVEKHKSTCLIYKYHNYKYIIILTLCSIIVVLYGIVLL